MAVSSAVIAVISARFLFLGPEVLFGDSEAADAATGGISEHFVVVMRDRYLRFAAHFIGGPIALFVGPFQFVEVLRRRFPGLHRGLGYLYVGGVAVSGLGGFVLAFGAFGGLTTGVGFGILAVLWLWFTGMAVWHARARRLALHRVWMIRSFALTFAAVMLRVYLPLLSALGASFEASYQTVAWLAWVPNLILAEALFVAKRRAG